jgi:hypothetical protein
VSIICPTDPDDPPPPDDEIEPTDLAAPARRLVDPRTLPARFHHLRAAGACGKLALHAFQGDSTDSLSKRLGSGTHALLFKPDRIAIWDQPSEASLKRAAKAKLAGQPVPPLTPAPRSGKDWAKFARDNAGKTILTKSERAAAERMADAIHSHARAHAILFGSRDAIYERSIVWAMNGRSRQSTPDVRVPGMVSELKTTRCAHPIPFLRDAEKKFFYHAQIADQRAAIKYETGHAPRESFIVAVESKEPHVVQVYELKPSAIERGEQLIAQWLEKLQIYETCDLWGGYSSGIEPWEILVTPGGEGPMPADPEWLAEDGKEAAPT